MTDGPTPRRTQAERTAATRAALLDATIAGLAEIGYARLTTREVAQRAQVSRGAQTHHFATKEDLVVAAVEHLFAERAATFEQRFTELAPGDRNVEGGLALLWEIVDGPSYAALLEVIVAGRTDPDLRVVVHALTARLEETVLGLLVKLMPGFDREVARQAIDIGFTLVQGAAVSTYSGYGDPERTIRLAGAVARLITPQTAPLLKGLLDDGRDQRPE